MQRGHAIGIGVAGMLAFTIMGAAVHAAKAKAPVLTTIHSFMGAGDGSFPTAGVVLDPRGSGALFGTTSGGGAAGHGTVFMLKPVAHGAWKKIVLHDFQGAPDDGSVPSGELLIDPDDGTIYGNTLQGGNTLGTVYRLTPPTGHKKRWQSAVIFSPLQPLDEGNGPNGALVFGHNHELIGTTVQGGAANVGAVFALTPPQKKGGVWSETVLHNFQQNQPGDGAIPAAGVVMRESDHTVFGTTWEGGGSANSGAVFMVDAQSRERVLHSFVDGNKGLNPVGSVVIGDDGALYGMTHVGGKKDMGVVFRMAPPSGGKKKWTFAVIHDFSNSATEGGSPWARLTVGSGGVLYGSTSLGGDSSCPGGCGAVFALTPPPAGKKAWKFRVLHTFTHGADGGQVQGALFVDKADHDTLYGTTLGDRSANFGTVFKLTH
jgi:uncharacterized repeat protein (TIGR03803 family)